MRNSIIDDSFHVNSLPKNYSYGSDLAEYLTDETLSENFSKPFTRFSRSYSIDQKPKKIFATSQRNAFRRNKTSVDFSPSFATLPSVDFDSYDPLAVIKETSDTVNYEEVGTKKVERKLFPKKLSSESRERRDSLKLDLHSELSIAKLPQRYKVLQSDDNSVGSLINEVRSKLLVSVDENKIVGKEAIEGKVSSIQNRAKLESKEVSKDEYTGDDEVFETPKKEVKKIPRLSRESKMNSVTIQETPEIFDAKSPSISHSNATANPKSTPSRGSLKKIASSSSLKKPSTSSIQQNSSDYGRSRPGGHRESFKKNDRTNDRLSEQDRDASDREHKDGSLNRSLSNTDTNIEDRIGKDIKKIMIVERF